MDFALIPFANFHQVCTYFKGVCAFTLNYLGTSVLGLLFLFLFLFLYTDLAADENSS
jgi:hypothetical protein